MMKRILTLLCVLCLLAGSSSAWAEEASAPDASAVYMLAGVSAEGETVYLGTAVLLGDQSTLVTTRWAVADADMVAIGAGGTLAVSESRLLCEGSSLMVLTLASPSPAKPLEMGASEENMTCVAATAEGLVIQRAQHATLTGYENEPALLYTGVAKALPGAVLLNSQGQLAGITTAGYGEGFDRYVAYPSDVIQARMKGEGPKTAEHTETTWITGLTLATDEGELTVDWSHLSGAEDAQDAAYYLIWQDTGNSFVSYAQVQWEDQSAAFGYIPGRSYRVWLQQSADGEIHLDGSLPEKMAAVCETAVTPPYAGYGFKDVTMYLGAAPKGAVTAETEPVPALEHFTLESLTDPQVSYYLQAISAYQVEAQQETVLTIALHAPDGSVYTYEGGFIFMPELNENDTWHADITSMISSCMEFTGGISGEYRLAYYLGGQLATEFLFVVE